MAKTVAERQKQYRVSRQVAGENGERRISAYVSTRAALALARVARCYGITQRELLEKVLIAEEDKVLENLDFDSLEGKKYFGAAD